MSLRFLLLLSLAASALSTACAPPQAPAPKAPRTVSIDEVAADFRAGQKVAWAKHHGRELTVVGEVVLVNRHILEQAKVYLRGKAGGIVTFTAEKEDFQKVRPLQRIVVRGECQILPALDAYANLYKAVIVSTEAIAVADSSSFEVYTGEELIKAAAKGNSPERWVLDGDLPRPIIVSGVVLATRGEVGYEHGRVWLQAPDAQNTVQCIMVHTPEAVGLQPGDTVRIAGHFDVFESSANDQPPTRAVTLKNAFRLEP